LYVIASEPSGERGNLLAMTMFYVSDFPQEGQNRSVVKTGLPHFGQKPPAFSLRFLRRDEIRDSISSSDTSSFAAGASARRAAMAFSSRDSSSRP